MDGRKCPIYGVGRILDSDASCLKILEHHACRLVSCYKTSNNTLNTIFFSEPSISTSVVLSITKNLELLWGAFCTDEKISLGLPLEGDKIVPLACALPDRHVHIVQDT